MNRDAGLRRGIGAFGLAIAIVNLVIGAGIFTLPAGMARAAGAYAIVAYVLCVIAMGAVVLCFAEAGSLPAEGSTAMSKRRSGPLAGLVAGVLLWLACVLGTGGIVSAFVATLGLFAPALSGRSAQAAVIVAIVGMLALINLSGSRRASRIIAAATLVKLIPLILFIVVGALFIRPDHLTQGVVPDAGGIGPAVLLSLLAFPRHGDRAGSERRGCETGAQAAARTDRGDGVSGARLCRHPDHRTGTAWRHVARSHRALVDAMATIDPRFGLLLIVGATASMGAWLGSDLLGAPRVLFAFARDGFLPSALGRVSPRTGGPVAAVLVHAAITVVLAVTGTFATLIVLSVLSACGLYAAGCAAAWVLRRRNVALPGPPLDLPALSLLAALGCGSMIVAILLAWWDEIGGFLAAFAASCLLHWFVRRVR